MKELFFEKLKCLETLSPNIILTNLVSLSMYI